MPAPEEDFLIGLLLKLFLLTRTLALSGELYPVIQRSDFNVGIDERNLDAWDLGRGDKLRDLSLCEASTFDL